MTYVLQVLIVVTYNLAILAGCSYLVFWKGHSAWWFLLAVMLLSTFSSKSTSTQ